MCCDDDDKGDDVTNFIMSDTPRGILFCMTTFLRKDYGLIKPFNFIHKFCNGILRDWICFDLKSIFGFLDKNHGYQDCEEINISVVYKETSLSHF